MFLQRGMRQNAPCASFKSREVQLQASYFEGAKDCAEAAFRPESWRTRVCAHQFSRGGVLRFFGHHLKFLRVAARQIYVVGVGHAAHLYELSAAGFDPKVQMSEPSCSSKDSAVIKPHGVLIKPQLNALFPSFHESPMRIV